MQGSAINNSSLASQDKTYPTFAALVALVSRLPGAHGRSAWQSSSKSVPVQNKSGGHPPAFANASDFVRTSSFVKTTEDSPAVSCGHVSLMYAVLQTNNHEEDPATSTVYSSRLAGSLLNTITNGMVLPVLTLIFERLSPKRFCSRLLMAVTSIRSRSASLSILPQ